MLYLARGRDPLAADAFLNPSRCGAKNASSRSASSGGSATWRLPSAAASAAAAGGGAAPGTRARAEEGGDVLQRPPRLALQVVLAHDEDAIAAPSVFTHGAMASA